ncbi:MAG: hypothetical protein KJ630_12675 [Proteobacteria bacterium]|nr:hypothetical protein [Pseudomonadota bacterium]
MIVSDSNFKRISSITKRTIFFSTVFSSLIVVAVTWILVGVFHKQLITNETREELDHYSNVLVNEHLVSIRGVLDRISKSEEVLHLLQKKEKNQSLELEQYLNGIAAGSNASIVYVMDGDGNVIACSRYDNNQTLLGKNYAFRKYFLDAMKGDEVLFAAVGVTTNERGLYQSRPVQLEGLVNPAGVAVVKMGVQGIEKVLLSMSHPSCIVSPSGVIFLSNRANLLYKMQQLPGEKELAALRESRQFADNPLTALPDAFEDNGKMFYPDQRIEGKSSLGLPGWQLIQWRGLQYPLRLASVFSVFALLFIIAGGIVFANWRERIIADRNLLLSQQLAEQNLREGYEILKRILEHLPVGVIVSDNLMNIRWINKAAHLLLRFPHSETIKDVAIGVDAIITDETGKSITEYPLGKNLAHLEGKLVFPGGDETPVLLDRTQFELGEDELFLHAIIDLSERKQMEANLMQARKMESIGQLAEGIAHEINTPAQFVGSNIDFIFTSVVDLFAALHHYEEVLSGVTIADNTQQMTIAGRLLKIREEADLDFLEEEFPIAAKQAQEGIDRIAKIVKALKDFSHPGAEGKIRAVDLNAAIETTLTVASNVWRETADVDLDFTPRLPPVQCLAGELNQVFLNFIVNGTHAIEDKMQKEHSTGKGVLKISTRQDGDSVEIRFSDTGTGIPAGIQDRIFDPFFTTKEVGRGSGQGLYVAHNLICNKLHGSLTFLTEPNAGTTFIVRLPLVFQDPNVC